MQHSEVESAIRELETDVKKVQEAISRMKELQRKQRSGTTTVFKRSPRRLSAQTRRRISASAKKRSAALRVAKKETSTDWRENKALETLAEIFSRL